LRDGSGRGGRQHKGEDSEDRSVHGLCDPHHRIAHLKMTRTVSNP
jgi:hypothetical protein